MEKVFSGPCRVWSKTEIEEGESEVEQHGEVNVDDEAVVRKVGGSVIFESWIVVGVMAMLERVNGEEEERLEQRQYDWSGASGFRGLRFRCRWRHGCG